MQVQKCRKCGRDGYAESEHLNPTNGLCWKCQPTEVLLEPAKPLECPMPPPGWRCTRPCGHDGPCAAVPDAAKPDLSVVAEEYAGEKTFSDGKNSWRDEYVQWLEDQRQKLIDRLNCVVPALSPGEVKQVEEIVDAHFAGNVNQPIERQDVIDVANKATGNYRALYNRACEREEKLRRDVQTIRDKAVSEVKRLVNNNESLQADLSRLGKEVAILQGQNERLRAEKGVKLGPDEGALEPHQWAPVIVEHLNEATYTQSSFQKVNWKALRKLAEGYLKLKAEAGNYSADRGRLKAIAECAVAEGLGAFNADTAVQAAEAMAGEIERLRADLRGCQAQLKRVKRPAVLNELQDAIVDYGMAPDREDGEVSNPTRAAWDKIQALMDKIAENYHADD